MVNTIRRLLIALVVVLLAFGVRDLQNQIDQISPQQVIRNDNLISAIQKVISSVVYVEVKSNKSYYGGWSGSGLIIAPNIILTAGHVVGGADNIEVKSASGRTYEAIGWYEDPNNDCGIIVLRSDFSNVLEFADSDNLQLGQRVFVVGSPFGEHLFNTVTFGIISGLGRDISFFGECDMITTDAASNPGNSGGPVFTMQGKIAGIIVGGYIGGDGLGVITPSNICKKLLNAYEVD